MKLGICYNLFDGEELLPFAIKEIRDVVDYIAIIYQTTSNKGEKLNYNLEWALGLVDEIYQYKPDLNKHCQENECRKRQIGRKLALEAGCTHHASLDVDEFFLKDQIEFAKQEAEKYDITTCYYANYFKNPCWKVHPDNHFSISFIHNIKLDFELDAHFPISIDRTRRLKGWENWRRFERDEVEMQHMTFIRKDIGAKIRNSSCSESYEHMLQVYNDYELGGGLIIPPDVCKRTTIEVPNYFDISF